MAHPGAGSGPRLTQRSAAVVTALAPVVGYDAAARIYKDAVEHGLSIRDAILRAGVVPAERLDEVLDLTKLARGGYA